MTDAKAARKKAASLIKKELSKFLRGEGLPGHKAATAGGVLFYAFKNTDPTDGPAALLAGYECCRGGLGRCLFCIWYVVDMGKWHIRVHDTCPLDLGISLEDLIEEVNSEG